MSRSVRLGWESSIDRLSRRLIESIDPSATPLLELGAGEGALTRLLRTHLPLSDIVAVDKRKVANSFASRTVHTAMEALPFPGAAFAAVASRFTLVYSIDLNAAVNELARVLCPGGIFVAQEFLIDRARPGSNVHPQHPSFFHLTEMMAEVWAATASERLPLALPGHLAKVGFGEIEIAPEPAMMVQLGKEWLSSRLSQLRDVSAFVIEKGIATAEEIESIAIGLQEEYGGDPYVAGIGLTTLGIRARRR